ncbi:MAG: DUF2189 domain-containing protein [Hyphomicrobiaceae bacterium]
MVRSIAPADLKDVLAKGLDDFWAMPTHVIFLVLIYPIVGILLARASFGYQVIPLLYPIAAGFALVGPIAGLGLYELSRRRELGMDTSWKHAFDVFHSPSLPVLGHATWHLYRKVVEPDLSPRPEYRPRLKGRRYGAEFPASLFFPSAREEPAYEEEKF